ncbi:MAG TPA: aldehyde dehydrogenase family protein [Pseudonocardia sp.]|nr:aldehyde dehydrogenase family protein [Pseudonocardia sp.]
MVDHVGEAVRRGATVLVGGEVPDGPGFFYPATVVTDVPDDTPLMTEETFGPVAPVRVVDSFDEALALARDSSFGLAATVYTNSAEHAERSRQLPVGMLWINQWQAGGLDRTYEPAGNSGLGITGRRAAFDAATRQATVITAPR